MTVFVNVLKEIILKTLEKIEKQSIASDYIPFYFRDSEFSKAQRELFGPLKRAINDFSAQSVLDPAEEGHHQSLKALLQTTLTDLNGLHKKTGHATGNTYVSLQKLINNIQELYDELLNFKTQDGKFTLLGLMEDKSPYSQLAYWSLWYLAARALDIEELVITERESQAPAIREIEDQGSIIKKKAQKIIDFINPDASSEKTQEEKKRCLQDHLSSCLTYIDALPEPRNQSILQGCVLDRIKLIMVENESICNEKDVGLTVPFSITSPFSFFSVNFSTKPGKGLLQRCMEGAKKSILASEMMHRKSAGTTDPESSRAFTSSFSSTQVSDRIFSSSFPPSLKAETPTTDLPASPAPQLEF